MQLMVHLSVELCLLSSGPGGGHREQLGSSVGKPPQPSSNAALRRGLGLDLVPGAWMEQERAMVGQHQGSGLQPCLSTATAKPWGASAGT